MLNSEPPQLSDIPKSVRAVVVVAPARKYVGRVDGVVLVGRIPKPLTFCVEIVLADNEIEASTGVKTNTAPNTPRITTEVKNASGRDTD